MSVILDGKKIAEKILEGIRREIKEKQLKLSLAVVSVGEESLFKTFVRQKEKACKKAGIDFNLFKFPETISKEDFKKEVEKIIEGNSGIVVQLPLPEHLQDVFNIIPQKKDPDVLSEESKEKFKKGELAVSPPVVCAVNHLLKEYDISLENKNIVLAGKGKLVGESLSIWLFNRGIDFSIIDKSTENPVSFFKKADVIISGVGEADLIRGGMVKEGVVIVDAGTSLKKGRLAGDVDFESVSKKAGYITPVPGGVGPLTVACLLENLVKLNS